MPKKSTSVGNKEVMVDRRRNDRRTDVEATANETVATPTAGNDDAKPARRKVQRRRQIDPTTCERDYSGKEIEFMHALDEYKRSAGRMFPTCSEILEVIRGLGYVQLTAEQAALLQSEEFGDEELVNETEADGDAFSLDDEEAELEESLR